MKRTMLSLAAALSLLALAPVAASAQQLPQSTLDRQSIANLQYRASLPSTSAEDRRQMQLQTSQLQYDINTRPPITAPVAAPPPPHEAAPPVPPYTYTTVEGRQITVTPVDARATGLIQLQDSIYASPDMCSASYGMIVYLNYIAGRADTTYQERVYIPHLINRIQHTMRNVNCPAA